MKKYSYKSSIDAMYEMYGNHNVESSNKTYALDDKYWNNKK